MEKRKGCCRLAAAPLILSSMMLHMGKAKTSDYGGFRCLFGKIDAPKPSVSRFWEVVRYICRAKNGADAGTGMDGRVAVVGLGGCKRSCRLWEIGTAD